MRATTAASFWRMAMWAAPMASSWIAQRIRKLHSNPPPADAGPDNHPHRLVFECLWNWSDRRGPCRRCLGTRRRSAKRCNGSKSLSGRPSGDPVFTGVGNRFLVSGRNAQAKTQQPYGGVFHRLICRSAGRRSAQSRRRPRGIRAGRSCTKTRAAVHPTHAVRRRLRPAPMRCAN